MNFTEIFLMWAGFLIILAIGIMMVYSGISKMTDVIDKNFKEFLKEISK